MTYKNISKPLLCLFFVVALAISFSVANEKSFFQNKLKAQLVPRATENYPELVNPLISVGQPTLTPTLLKCQKNSDCVLVETACCSCREGGTVDSVKAMNKDLLTYFMTRMSVFCPEVTERCKSHKYNCLKKLYPTPLCKNNMCEAVDYERDMLRRKEAKDYSRDNNLNDIKLSCEVASRWVKLDDSLGFWNLKLTALVGDNNGCEDFIYFKNDGYGLSTGQKENVWWQQTLPQQAKSIRIEKQIKALCVPNNKIYGTATCKKMLDAKNPSNIDELMPLEKRYTCEKGLCVETVYGGTTSLDSCKKSCKDWSSGMWKCVNGKCIDDSRGLYTGKVFLSEKECDSWCFDGPSR